MIEDSLTREFEGPRLSDVLKDHNNALTLLKRIRIAKKGGCNREIKKLSVAPKEGHFAVRPGFPVLNSIEQNIIERIIPGFGQKEVRIVLLHGFMLVNI